METETWKPSDLIKKLVWAWDYPVEDGARVGILDAILTVFGDEGCLYAVGNRLYKNIRPLIPEEHPELFYKGESSDAKR
jgi:hypothetical protein